MRRWPTTLASTLLIAAVASAQDAPQIEDFEFDVTTLDGRRLTQEDFRDRVLLVDIWGTWCGPCRKAVPVLSRIYERWHEKGLVILGLNYENLPDARALAKVRAFAAKHEIPYPLALGPEGVKAQVPGFRGYPTLLYFERGLSFDHLEVGFDPAHAEAIEAWVEAAVAEKGPASAKKKEARFKDFVLEDVSKGGRTSPKATKLVVGDGKCFVLLALEHPRAPVDQQAIDLLAKEVAAEKLPLSVQVLRRAEQGAAAPGFHAKLEDLKKLGLGYAFPAYLVVSPEGRVVARAAGRGEKALARFAGKIADSAARSVAQAKKAAATKAGAKSVEARATKEAPKREGGAKDAKK